MLELLQILLDALSRLGPAAVGSLAKSERTEIGRKLMSVYVTTNLIVVQGEEISDLVGALLAEEGAEPHDTRLVRLGILLKLQGAALAELSVASSDLSYPLAALDGSAAATVDAIANAKAGRIHRLAQLMQSGRLINVARRRQDTEEIPHLVPMANDAAELEDKELLTMFAEQWGSDRHLEDLRHSAERLRSSLLETFSLHEVLPPPYKRRSPMEQRVARALGLGGNVWRWR